MLSLKKFKKNKGDKGDKVDKKKESSFIKVALFLSLEEIKIRFKHVLNVYNLGVNCIPKTRHTARSFLAVHFRSEGMFF